jgi:hypothetical protein
LSTTPEHKIVFALVITIVVLLVALAMYLNYEFVAKERGLSIMADIVIYEMATGSKIKSGWQLEI